MAGFCLPPEIAKNFIKTLQKWESEGVLDKRIQELVNLPSSEMRNKAFESIVGAEYAKGTNTLFESKILLKNQQIGFGSWARSITESKIRTDILRKIEKMDKYLNPSEEAVFLRDLVETKLKTIITFEEARVMHELSVKEVALRKNMNPNTFTFADWKSRMDYGRAAWDLVEYANGLKTKSSATTLADVKRSPIQSIGHGIVELGGLMKSLKASFDNSVIGRQGLKILLTHPKTWNRNQLKSWSDLYRSFKGEDVTREVMADIMSRPNYLNGKYLAEKVDLGVSEEAYPTSLPEKMADVSWKFAPIKLLGKTFKASQDAFTLFQRRSRADLFDQYVNIADKTGADIRGLGRVVNSLTGRGHLGPLEPISKLTNNLFFSPRFFKSNLDILTGNITDYGSMGTFAKKQAAYNSAKAIIGIATILLIAKAVNPDSVELDYRSSDAGKIRVGNTRFDVSGGTAAIATLATRLARYATKNSTTGKITELNTGKYGSKTIGDVIWQFVTNKASPSAQMVNEIFIKGVDYNYNPVTLQGELTSGLMPLPITNYQELSNDPEATALLISAGLLSDFVGIGTNTY